MCRTALDLLAQVDWGTDALDGRDLARACLLLLVVMAVPPLAGVRIMYTWSWLGFTAAAWLLGSLTALGMATTMGATVLIGWQALRIVDHGAYAAARRGWLGVWATWPYVALTLRVADAIVHVLLPMLLLMRYMAVVRVWMSVPVLIASRLWVYLAIGPGLFPKGDHVFRFVPPRSQHFWDAAYKIEMSLNLCVPLFCVLAHQRCFRAYTFTAAAGGIILLLQFVRFLALQQIRLEAKGIMLRLLGAGGLQLGVDFFVRDDAIWLDWMRDGLIAIGETYVGGLWDVGPNRTLDDIVVLLMTIPMPARRAMYRSWRARIVALVTRLLNSPSSSNQVVVGAVSVQFDMTPQFRQTYMDPFLHQGFAVWPSDDQDGQDIQEAQERALASIATKLDLQPGHRVLDISLGSWGGVGLYLAEHHADIRVLSCLTSSQELAYATNMAQTLDIASRIEFVVINSPEKMLSILSTIPESSMDRIAAGSIVEVLRPFDLPRLFSALKRIQAPAGGIVLEMVACVNAYVTIHEWTNKYIDDVFPRYALTLARIEHLLVVWGFTIREIASHADQYDRTFVTWYRRFQAHWPSTDALQSPHASAAPATPRSSRPDRSLPESFRRTWEFYLLHSAACYRSRRLQVYQLCIS